jgi:hypothetical protein
MCIRDSYYGAEDAVVVQDGRQMTIKVAWLSRIKGQRAKGGKNIGRTWESYKGTRTVVGTYKDTGKWLVQMEGDTSGRLEVFNTAQLESEIAFDAKQLARHKSLAPEREAKAKAHAAAVAREGAEEADYVNTWGYGETLSAMARARAIKALNKQVGFNGRFARRKDEIYRLVTQKGWRTAQQRSWGRVLQSPDGAFLVQKDLTKTGLDFADYLAAKGQRAKGGRFDVSVYKADQASRFPGEWVVESIDSAARANRREVRPFPTKAKAQAYAKSLRAWKAYQPRGGDLGGGQRASTIDTLKIANKNFDDARHAYDAAPTQANHTAMRTAYAARTRAYKADQAVWDLSLIHI